jgi:hypothetical protein
METDIVGAIKIKDGLFIGDEFAAQDLEFVVANKVTHIINCAGRQVPNHWEPIGVQYLTYFWYDQDTQVDFSGYWLRLFWIRETKLPTSATTL